MSEARLTTATDSKNLADALWLKGLVLDSRALALPSGHPLRPGFDALARSLTGQFLNELHREELAILKARAKLLRSVEADWREHNDKLVAKLQDLKQCGSVLFELDLGSFLVGRGLRPRWRAFEPGVPDWCVSAPGFEVECKQARSAAKSSNYRHYLREIASQHPDRSGPLVAAIGFAQPLHHEQVGRMREEAKRHLPWMTQHREISAVLVVASEPGIVRGKWLGVSGFKFQRQTVTEIRNLNAWRPLPPEMRFGSGRSPESFGFPGAMQSMTRRVGEEQKR